MNDYIKEYVKEIDKVLEKNIKDIDKTIEKHLIKINFFQHERTIHLLVTLSYAFITVIGFMSFIVFEEIIILFIPLLLLCFLIPYILHYFVLENNVQKMYTQYDKMLERKNESK